MTTTPDPRPRRPRRTAGAIATLVGLVLIADLLVQALPSPWNTDIERKHGPKLREMTVSDQRRAVGAAVFRDSVRLPASEA